MNVDLGQGIRETPSVIQHAYSRAFINNLQDSNTVYRDLQGVNEMPS